LKFIKGNDVIHVCDLALTELVLTLHVYSQGMVIPDQRSHERRIVSVLVEAVFWPQENHTAWQWVEIQRPKGSNNVQ
jgi:hypothetical protein